MYMQASVSILRSKGKIRSDHSTMRFQYEQTQTVCKPLVNSVKVNEYART